MCDYQKFVDIAYQLRQDVVRVTTLAGSGHPGGALSATDFLTVLYFHVLNHRPKEPGWEDRDIVIYSKGHSTPVIYPLLARSGYFDPKELMTFRKLHSRLQGMPSMVYGLPGIEVSSGSLGQNLSVAAGMALGLRERKKFGYRHVPNVFAICGDGELNEGNMWEGIMMAAHYHLDNLIAIVDKNKMQIDGTTKDVMNIDPLPEKFEAFNWNVVECDGHNYRDIVRAFNDASKLSGKPIAIIADTIKGKGISLMEGKLEWHGKPPSKEQALAALRELGADETLEIMSTPVYKPVDCLKPW